MDFDPLYIITIVSVSLAAAVSYFTIRNEFKKSKEQERLAIIGQMKTESESIKSHLDETIRLVDSKFKVQETRMDKNDDDIKDIEVDMKQLQYDLKSVCEKLSKHDYIVQAITPEFKALQKEFYTFKTTVEHTLKNGK